MSFLYILLVLFLSVFNDPENKSEKSVTVVMEVAVEVVPGTILFDQLTQNVEASSNSNKFQIGFKEFTISFPAESEIITGEVTKSCSDQSSCNSYMVANIEKLNNYTGKLKIHYLVGNRAQKEEQKVADKHTATIIYL